MTDTTVEQAFRQMGAMANVVTARDSVSVARRVRVNVIRDGGRECFDVLKAPDTAVFVADVDVMDRHLLLVAADADASLPDSRFLCGFDERSWFVAAVPESAGARTVQEAKDALKPAEVWESMREYGVPMEQRDRRRTAGFVRQGEWFFLPQPMLEVFSSDMLFNEPIQRGVGKPHFCERLYRVGGEDVWVSASHPNGLTDAEHDALDPTERYRQRWRLARRNAEVYVGGQVRHPDHETIVLPFWHRVVMNTETLAAAMEDVDFLD